MQTCSSNLAAILALVGWVITGLGWFVTSSQANARETKKELRSKIDALIESIELSEEIALEYYSNDGEMRQKFRLKLFPSLQKIETKTSILTKHDKSFNEDLQFSVFWEAITDGDFDSSTLPKLEATDLRFAKISSASCAFIKSVENWYITHGQ